MNDHGNYVFYSDTWEEEEGEHYCTPDEAEEKRDAYSAIKQKQRSLERGGSLRPPPRQNSISMVSAFISASACKFLTIQRILIIFFSVFLFFFLFI